MGGLSAVRHRAICGAFTILATPSFAAAREYGIEIIVDSVDDLYGYEQRGELGQSDVETLAGFLSQPVNLNRASPGVLSELPGVTRSLANRIARDRARQRFKRVEDVKRVPGVSDTMFMQMRPFVVVKQPQGAFPKRNDAQASSSSARAGFVRTGVQLRRGFVPPWDPFERVIDDSKERSFGTQGFAQFRASSSKDFEAGASIAHRRGIDIAWDPAFNGSTGRFVSADGPGNRARLEQVYVKGAWGQLSGVLGSFNAGFGERLTFNTSRFSQPHGWYPNLILTEDNELARIRPRDGLFGGALRIGEVAIGSTTSFDLTLFASSNGHDLYQRDLAYEGQGPVCEGDTGYRCAPEFSGTYPDHASETSDFVLDGRARSSRVSSPDGRTHYDFEQIRNAYREELLGGNATLRLGSGFAMGMTSYVGRTRFNLDVDSEPNFSESSGRVLRQLGVFGAAGMSARWKHSGFDCGAEYARSFVSEGGSGALLRVSAAPVDGLDLVGQFWRYGAHFINPHGNATAGADEVFGESNRNEAGGQLRVVARPHRAIQMRTSVEYRRNPNHIFLTASGYRTLPRSVPLDDFGFGQRLAIRATSREQIFFGVEYSDRVTQRLDLDRVEYSKGGDTCLPLVRENREGKVVSDCAVGARLKAQIGLNSRRFSYLSFYVRGEYIRLDAGDVDEEGYPEKSEAFRLVIRSQFDAWPGAKFIVRSTIHPTAVLGRSSEDEYTAILGSAPQQSHAAEYIQEIGGSWTLKSRVGIQQFDRSDPTNRFDVVRFGSYATIRFKTEYRF